MDNEYLENRKGEAIIKSQDRTLPRRVRLVTLHLIECCFLPNLLWFSDAIVFLSHE